jgi:hypothetical protein
MKICVSCTQFGKCVHNAALSGECSSDRQSYEVTLELKSLTFNNNLPRLLGPLCAIALETGLLSGYLNPLYGSACIRA